MVNAFYSIHVNFGGYLALVGELVGDFLVGKINQKLPKPFDYYIHHLFTLFGCCSVRIGGSRM